MLDRKWLYGILGLAALAVIATALGLYFTMSARTDAGPAAPGHPAVPKAAATPENTVPPAAVPSIEVAAEKLAQRLRTQDGTADDWALLARSYVQMRRYAEAVDAFGKALQKSPGNAAFTEEQAAARKAADGK